MVDEDFVLGYVTGYNDGIGSGSGGGSPIPEIVLDNVYRFGSSDYGVGTINYAKSNFCNLSTVAAWVTEPGPNGRVWGPPSSKQYVWGYARMKGEKIIGIVMSNVTLATENTDWSYATGSWVKTGGTSPVFGECRVVLDDRSTEYNEIYKMVIYVDGVENSVELAIRNIDQFGWNATPWYGGSVSAHLMADSDYTAWVTALSKNGITLEEV